ncbi:MAG: AraC family transcriptional regulator [Spirochaetales bacterium]|nr:AraC family transcriptional regulator [Spirochaetales bacterium]
MTDQHNADVPENVAYANLTELAKELPYQLIGVGCDFEQTPIDRPFGYPAYQWIQSLEGTGKLRLGQQEYAVPPGHGMILYSREAHAYWSSDGPWMVHWISFDGNHVGPMLQKLGFGESGVHVISNTAVLAAHMHQALRLLSRQRPFTGLDGSVLIYQLLFDLHREVCVEGSPSRQDRALRLQPIVDYIDHHLDHVLSVDLLAQRMGVTAQHFCVLFKDATGQRPVEYINARRIKRAKDLLVSERDLHVGEVGRRVGFENNSYFSTVFRKIEGMSPRKYKDLH